MTAQAADKMAVELKVARADEFAGYFVASARAFMRTSSSTPQLNMPAK
jgi:hypothetical protein